MDFYDIQEKFFEQQEEVEEDDIPDSQDSCASNVATMTGVNANRRRSLVLKDKVLVEKLLMCQ